MLHANRDLDRTVRPTSSDGSDTTSLSRNNTVDPAPSPKPKTSGRLLLAESLADRVATSPEIRDRRCGTSASESAWHTSAGSDSGSMHGTRQQRMAPGLTCATHSSSCGPRMLGDAGALPELPRPSQCRRGPHVKHGR